MLNKMNVYNEQYEIQRAIQAKCDCAVYAHREDIKDVIHFIKKWNKGYVDVDSSTYQSVGNVRQNAGFFIVYKKNRVKFQTLLNEKDTAAKKLYVWNAKQGDKAHA